MGKSQSKTGDHAIAGEEQPAEDFVAPPSASIEDFSIVREIGRGSFGMVYQVNHKVTGDTYAMKELDKRKIIEKGAASKYRDEVLLQYTAGMHDYIVNLRFACYTTDKVYLVLDFCEGGDLFHLVELEKRIPEDRVQQYAAEICLALEFIHEKNIIYRDLKLENILLDRVGHIRLTDFGLAKHLVDENTRTFCGTREYMAPEILLRKNDGYGIEVDYWAFGVVLFSMLAGRYPFYSDKMSRLYQKILNEDPVFPDHFSASARDLVSKLLAKKPSERIHVDQIRTHPFFTGVDWVAVAEKRTVPSFRPPPMPNIQHSADNFVGFDNSSPPSDAAGAASRSVRLMGTSAPVSGPRSAPGSVRQAHAPASPTGGSGLAAFFGLSPPRDKGILSAKAAAEAAKKADQAAAKAKAKEQKDKEKGKAKGKEKGRARGASAAMAVPVLTDAQRQKINEQRRASDVYGESSLLGSNPVIKRSRSLRAHGDQPVLRVNHPPPLLEHHEEMGPEFNSVELSLTASDASESSSSWLHSSSEEDGGALNRSGPESALSPMVERLPASHKAVLGAETPSRWMHMPLPGVAGASNPTLGHTAPTPGALAGSAPGPGLQRAAASGPLPARGLEVLPLTTHNTNVMLRTLTEEDGLPKGESVLVTTNTTTSESSDHA